MRVLIVENMDGTPLGQIGVALTEGNIETQHIAAHRGERLPQTAEAFDGLIVLGGEQNALDDENYPYMPELCGLMREFTNAEKAVLGVCLGSQLLARAYTAENLLNYTREFGWQDIELTAAGKQDAVLGDLDDNFTSFQWHVDSFTLPNEAAHLAGNGAAKNQAFRIGRASYGMQFHFEANQNVVRTWCDGFKASVEKMSPGFLARFEDERTSHGAIADENGLKIARNWVKTLSR